MKIQQNKPEWKEIELGEIMNFDDGDWILSENMDSSGNYGIIQLKHIGKGKFLDKSFQFITENKFKELKCLEILEGDLIISRMAEPICRSCIVPKISHKLITAVDIAIARPSKDIYIPYLNYLFNSNLIKDRAERYAAGTTRKRISKRNLGKIKIPLPFSNGKPDIEKQKQIVDILENLERLKEKRKKTISHLDDYLKSVFNEMFVGKGFEEVKIGDVSKLAMGGTPSTKEKDYWENGVINWMKSGDIKGDFIYSIPNKITELGFKNSNTTKFPIDTVVIALNGQGKTRGTTAILKIETTSNQSVVGIVPDDKKLISEYLHFNLKLRYNELRNLTGDKDRSGLNLSLLRNFKIPLPPLALQKEFAKIVEKIEKQKEKQKQSLEKIEELFSSSLNKAFKGELI